MKKTIFLFLILILIFVASCNYTKPLQPISDRVGVYEDTVLQYTVTIPPSAESIDIKVPKLDKDGNIEKDDAGETVYNSFFISTFGPGDVRLDYYTSTGLMRVVLDAKEFNTLYLYTNVFDDDGNYGTLLR